jgi:dolichol-phosphate mannosyltransferase
VDLKIDPQHIIAGMVKNRVTIVLPTLNESGAISQVIEELRDEGYNNIVVVDGYSTDMTDRIAFGNGVELAYQHGVGKAGAVRTALEHAKTPYVLFMDGDATYDPKDIWRLSNHTDHYAHVIGARDRKHIGHLHRYGNWMISQLFSLLFGVRVSDVCSGMYLLETVEAKTYSVEEPGFVVEIELAAQSASQQQLTEVPINYRPRIGDRKPSTWRDGRAILSAAFKLAWRYNPILVYSGLAGLLLIPAASILLWTLFDYLARGAWHTGWALLAAIFVIVATQSITLTGASVLTKRTEQRILREIRNQKTA